MATPTIANSLAFCSIATRAYLPQARALGAGLRRHHPDASLYLLVVDATVTAAETAPFQPICLADLPQRSHLADMSFYYDAFELSNALKGELHRYMLERTGAQRWIYLDADIMVLGNLEDALKPLETCSILLTQHVTQPFAGDQFDPAELNIAKCGIYNGGFLGLRRSNEAEQFIGWFASRLTRHAFRFYRGQFVDQLWLNLVPSFFQSTALCSDAGVNVAHWNLHERRLTEDAAGQFKVNDSPLLLLHLSGWNANEPDEVSVYAKEYRGRAPAAWSRLGRMYLELLKQHGFEPGAPREYGFAAFDDGHPITREMRRYFHDMIEQGRRPDRSPFSMSNYFRTKFGSRAQLKELAFHIAREGGRLLLHSKPEHA